MAERWEPGQEWQTVNAIHAKALGLAEKAVLIVIAKHESRRDRICYASLDTIAAEAGCEPKTARKVLRGLGESALVETIEVAGRASRRRILWAAFRLLEIHTPAKNGRGQKREMPGPDLGEAPRQNGVGGVKSLGTNNKGQELRVSAPVEKAASPLVPHRPLLPQQIRFSAIKRLTPYCVALIEGRSNTGDGDLAECLKEYAAHNKIPYSDNWQGANSIIQQVIVNARAIVAERGSKPKPPRRATTASHSKMAAAG